MFDTDAKQITISATAFDDLLAAAAFGSGILQGLSFSQALYDEQRKNAAAAAERINAANDAAIEAMRVSL